MKKQTRRKLEYKLLFAMIVAGKSARHARKAMDRLQVAIESLSVEHLWFPALREIDDAPKCLATILRCARTGNYRKVERAFREVINAGLNLKTCTVADLERIHGIGPKTARFFILWTRPDAQCAALDVHILRWLAEIGHDAPKSTPAGKWYAYWEMMFIGEARRRDMTPAQLDEQIWLASNKSGVKA